MKCLFCPYEKSRWLWLAIECRPQPVCYDCALTRDLYCTTHQYIMLDLDDGTLCPLCVDALPELQDVARARQVYRRVRKYLDREMCAKLVEWVALARYAEPMPKYWSLWWAIVAKVHRTEESVATVVAKIIRSRDLSALVPFSDSIQAADVAQLNPLLWVHMVEQKGFPVSYAEALWRSAVAKAKLGGNTLIGFLEELSQSLPVLKQSQSKET